MNNYNSVPFTLRENCDRITVIYCEGNKSATGLFSLTYVTRLTLYAASRVAHRGALGPSGSVVCD